MLNLYPNYIFWNKVLNQVTVRKNALWRFLPVQSISVRGLGKAPAKKELEERLQAMLGSLREALLAAPESEKRLVIEQAEEALSHTFNLLGSGPVKMGQIDWHTDFKTGHNWPKGVFYKKQRQATAPRSDIKVPWELSRGHHLLWLGEAYLLTGEERFAREVVDEMEDWINANPLMYSVNWTCTMDVAIRAVNWLYAIAMIIESDTVTETFVEKIYKSLYRHGWFIYNNLEKNIPFSNNHLFSDYAGLVYLSVLFKDTGYGKKWQQFVIPEFYEEIRHQVLPSGVHYERSVSYHRLMTELASYPCYLLKRVGYAVPADIEYRVRSMYSYVANYTKGNGCAPLIEDNDDGRFLPFVCRDFRRHDYLLDKESTENRMAGNGLEHFSSEKAGTRLYEDAGHAIIRRDEAYLFVTNGGFSKYETPAKEQGTHTHNDRLSFELAVGQDDIIVDPGAYVYTPDPEKSNEFHSTAKHNTAVVDGEEQNGLSRENVFLLKKNSRTTRFELESEDTCSGEYVTLGQSLTHRRTFCLTRGCLGIEDRLAKAGVAHHAVLSFHLAPDVDAAVQDGKAIVKSDSCLLELLFEVVDGQSRLFVEDDTYSPSYGVLQPSKTLRLEVEFDEATIINTKIQWQKRQ